MDKELKRYQIYYWIEQVECSDITVIGHDIIEAIHSCELWIEHNYKDCPYEIMDVKLVDKTVDVDRFR